PPHQPSPRSPGRHAIHLRNHPEVRLPRPIREIPPGMLIRPHLHLVVPRRPIPVTRLQQHLDQKRKIVSGSRSQVHTPILTSAGSPWSGDPDQIALRVGELPDHQLPPYAVRPEDPPPTEPLSPLESSTDAGATGVASTCCASVIAEGWG